MRLGEKCCKFVLICFWETLENFEFTLEKIHPNNPFGTFALGNFNKKPKRFSKTYTSSFDNSMIDDLESKLWIVSTDSKTNPITRLTVFLH